MSSLTARQQQVLDVVRHYVSTTGYPPTRADIARELGFKSANAAEEHLKALARKGAIEMVAGASRGIILPEAGGLPIIGKVAAGSPIFAEAHIEDHVDIQAAVFNPRADYLLRVSGMSMRDAGILEDDLLAVHRCSEARKGQIVVARIDDEVTVKRLGKHSAKCTELLPENPDFEPIIVEPGQQFSIEGLSVGIIRLGV